MANQQAAASSFVENRHNLEDSESFESECDYSDDSVADKNFQPSSSD